MNMEIRTFLSRFLTCKLLPSALACLFVERRAALKNRETISAGNLHHLDDVTRDLNMGQGSNLLQTHAPSLVKELKGILVKTA